jgi:hypothetical protein
MMGFLWYLFQEVVIQTEKLLRMILFFQPLLPQPPSGHGLEENSGENTIREYGSRVHTK